jgi:hypothetical protein
MRMKFGAEAKLEGRIERVLQMSVRYVQIRLEVFGLRH